jgi:amino acid transporter
VVSTETLSAAQILDMVRLIAGYLDAPIFAGPAELLLLQHVLDAVAPSSFTHIAIIILWGFALLNILGIDLFASIQRIITYTMLVIGLAGLNPTSANGATPSQIWQGFVQPDGSVFSLVSLALWAFLSFELICPLIEESKRPRKTFPKPC